jgi:hypothetical protein
MPLNIQKGPKATPTRAVIYGVAGIGKSTLCAELFPDHGALFIDTEESTGQLDVARVTPKAWRDVTSTLVEIARDPQGFKAVVIDTADWAELLATAELLRRTGKKSIEDYGFGKGFVMLAESMKELLEACDAVINAGLHVVLVAHSKVVRVSPPDETEGFDRYELKLTKQTAPLVKEWADCLLFLKFGLQMVEGKDGRTKGTSTGQRVIHTEQSAAWDAKNRFGLPPTIEYSKQADAVQALAPVFGRRVVARSVAGVAAPAPVAQPAPAALLPAQSTFPITPEQEAKIRLYAGNDVCAQVIERALTHYGNPLDCLTSEQADKIISRCQEEMNAAAGSKPAPKPATSTPRYPFVGATLAWLEANEAAVNDYLLRLQTIQTGQTFRDVSPEVGDSIQTNPARIARKLGIAAP